MPKRRRRRSKRRKRLRRPRMRRSSRLIRRTILGQKLPITHPYFTQLLLNPSAGTLVARIYSANSLFQTDFTGSGGQPRGFDQIANLFGKFTVVGGVITVDFLNRSTNADNTYIVGVALRPNTTVENLRNYMEGRNVRSVSLGQNTGTRRIRFPFSIGKQLSISKPMSEVSLRGTISVTYSSPLASPGTGNLTCQNLVQHQKYKQPATLCRHICCKPCYSTLRTCIRPRW